MVIAVLLLNQIVWYSRTRSLEEQLKKERSHHNSLKE